MKHLLNSRSERGFSSLEIAAAVTSGVLVVAFALSMAFDLKNQESDASARRAAKILAATAENAKVAGDQLIVSAATKEEAIGLLNDGVAGKGAFEDFEYKVNLSERRQKKVLRYLNFEDGNLVYDGGDDID
jgi:hypothetical protein